ncbi:HAD-like domain-containing protein [Phakopsora pachyrhizi]|nr:HAD-like domain-containing protein [Phakopsora pachyrhizi]
MDGLLLDSETLYTKITDEILAPYNKQLTWEIKSLLMGRPALESASILVERTGIPMSAETLISAMFKRQQVLFPTVNPMPGAVRLIATGSVRRNFQLKSMNLPELFSHFKDHVICGDDPELKRGKPNPDPFLLAAHRHLGLNINPDPVTGFYDLPKDIESHFEGIKPEEILVFEDGLAGVRSAKAAGMKVIWVPDPELKKLPVAPENKDIVADQTLNSLKDWDGSFWNLVPLP